MQKHITSFQTLDKSTGFTLLELMIVLVISAIVSLGAYAAYSLQSKSYSTQREVARVQQDLRGSLYMLESDILNIGRDPYMSNRYGITNVGYFNFTPGTLDTAMAASNFVMPADHRDAYFASFPVLEFTSLGIDADNDGIGDSQMAIRYQIFDFGNDGRPDLCRRANPGMRVDNENTAATQNMLVAEGVVAIGYAFAYNPNPDGHYRMARSAPGNNVIWGADTDGDGQLDTNLDANQDGVIDITDDDLSNDGVIDTGDRALVPPVDLRNVVAVRIWIMLQSDRESQNNIIDQNNYLVGNRIIPPRGTFFNDRFIRRVETVTLALRNFKKS